MFFFEDYCNFSAGYSSNVDATACAISFEAAAAAGTEGDGVSRTYLYDLTGLITLLDCGRYGYKLAC